MSAVVTVEIRIMSPTFENYASWCEIKLRHFCEPVSIFKALAYFSIERGFSGEIVRLSWFHCIS